jgi:hypothetical protein
MPNTKQPDEHAVGCAEPSMVPYVTTWSAEKEPSGVVVERSEGGIGYQDEGPGDRDAGGVLWCRIQSSPGEGRPLFGDVHSMRQRRAMLQWLCQVCGGPADRTGEGVLWLLKDQRQHWEWWPNNVAVTEPPVCLGCVGVAVRTCPALREGAAAVRVKSAPTWAVRGMLYRPEEGGVVPTRVMTVALDEPAVRWIQATKLVRVLRGCTLLSLDEVMELSSLARGGQV